MTARSQFPTLKPFCPKPLPREFGQDYRSESSLDVSSNTMRGRSAFVTIRHMQTSHKKEQNMKAHQQRKEIFDDLALSNISAMDLLRRLSECTTPFSRLLKRVIEELEFTSGVSRSQKVDDLERDAAVESAKKEVEVQQVAQRLSRIKQDGVETRKILARHQRRLENMNKDIKRLEHLSGLSVCDEEEQKQKVFTQDGVRTEAVIPLDDDKYKALWLDHTELLDQITEQKRVLETTQERQRIAMRDRVREIRVRTAT